jgi:tellurite resistance protein TerB
MGLSIREHWSREIRKLRSRSFLDASMAAAALITTSDQEVRLAEQLALDRVLERLDELRVFDPHTGVELHRRYAEQLEADPHQGRSRILALVSHFRGDTHHAELILYVAAAVAMADSDLSGNEQQLLGDLCQHLGLSADRDLPRIFASV